MPTTLKPQNLLVELFDLILIQLSNWRWSWRSMITTGTLAPVLSTLALAFFTRGQEGRTFAFILTGNLVLALMFNNLTRVANNFAFMRAYGMLSYFATLPVRGASLVLATVLAFFLLSLPSVFATLGLGVIILKLSLQVHPLVVVALPLAAIPLAGLGALIGASLRTPEEAASLSLLLTYVMLGLGPVLVPPESLPRFLVTLGYLSPATYAASALRQVLLGPVTGRILLDLAVLTGISLVILWLVERKMAWRQSQT
ncbi:MAG: ABC transporter permease [Chloroflexota bacterium]